ncbi:MAG: hypothetical protein WB524_05740 [Acidobacteriaceae bacterium]
MGTTMYKYAYAYRTEQDGDEVFFRFPQLPEIISTVPLEQFRAMSAEAIQAFATDAVLTALQTRISGRLEIPSGDNQELILRADGFVNLSIQQSLKIELFDVYKQNCKTIVEFSRRLGKKETAARRLLNLHHQSWVTEIEAAMASFGRRILPTWHIESGLAHGSPPKQASMAAHR